MKNVLMQKAEGVTALVAARIMGWLMRSKNEVDSFIRIWICENLLSTAYPVDKWLATDGLPDMQRLLKAAMDATYEYAKEEKDRPQAENK